MSEYKTVRGEVELKATGSGALTATFARFGVPDRDRDVILPTAIADGTELLLGAWNHSSISPGTTPPIGKGRVVNDGTRAQVVATIFPNTAAQEQYSAIKGLGSLCEWSFGFRVLEQSTDLDELAAYPGAKRILRELEVFEVCPVFAGAGVNTGTDSAKGIRLSDLGIAPSFLSDLKRRSHVRIEGLPELVRDELRHIAVARFMGEEVR